VHFYDTHHKPNFGGKSEAGKSVAIVSARQHRPEGPKSDCVDSKQEKCGASMAALRAGSEKVGTGFSKRSCFNQKI
jgi:hypothetical protein